METILNRFIFLYFILIIFSTTSCKETCSGSNTGYKNTFFSIKVTEEVDPGLYLHLNGIDILSKGKVVYSHQFPWAIGFSKKISISDTVMKQQGMLRIFILKKNEIIASDEICNEKRNEYCGTENIIINRQDTTKVQYEINAENEYFFDKCACKRDKTVKTILNQIKSIKDSINNLKLRNF